MVVASDPRSTPARTWLEEGHLAGLVAVSPAGRAFVRDLLRTAARPGAVLLRGPAGSGKHAAARALHALRDAAGPLVIAHELGTARQAPSDATVVLPDLDGWSQGDQRALVRLLDSGRGPRGVGLTRAPRGSRALRDDLLHRLSLNTLELPPLSARGADIEPLALHHLARLPPDADGQPWRLTTEAVLSLRRHAWPGNVRELFQTLERGTHRARRGPLRTSHLGLPEVHTASDPTRLTLAEVERRHVRAVLDAHDGNVTEASRALGVPRSTLYRRLKRWGLTG